MAFKCKFFKSAQFFFYEQDRMRLELPQDSLTNTCARCFSLVCTTTADVENSLN